MLDLIQGSSQQMPRLSKQTVPDPSRKGRRNLIAANWPKKKVFFWIPLKQWLAHILEDKSSQILVDHYQVTKVLAWMCHDTNFHSLASYPSARH